MNSKQFMRQSITHAVAFVIAASLFAVSGKVFLAVAAEAKAGQVQVEASGSAETRDGALIDACRLAVAKVHGTRIVGRMANRDSTGLKIDKASKKDGEESLSSFNARTYEVADNTSMSFDGLLLRYEVKKEERQKDGRWLVQILADVLNTIPDKFAGKQAVVLPSVARIATSLSTGNADAGMAAEVAQELARALGSVFSNHPQFVLLERESEDIVNEELARASGDNAEVKQQSKLKGEKTADIVVEIKSEPIKIAVNTTNFESTPPLQKIQIELKGDIRLIDVSTKGIICSTPFEAANIKPVVSAGDVGPAVQKALGEFKARLNASLRAAKCDLMAKLGVANLVFDQPGRLILGGGIDAKLLQTGDFISLWKGDDARMIKIGDSSIIVEGNSISLENRDIQIEKGDVFSFRVETTLTTTTTTARDIIDPITTPISSKPSLKDKIKFDN